MPGRSPLAKKDSVRATWGILKGVVCGIIIGMAVQVASHNSLYACDAGFLTAGAVTVDDVLRRRRQASLPGASSYFDDGEKQITRSVKYGAVVFGAAAVALDGATLVEFAQNAGEIMKNIQALSSVAPTGVPALLVSSAAVGYYAEFRRRRALENASVK